MTTQSTSSMVLGIDAFNLRGGGGTTHIREFLAAADPQKHGFQRIVIWGVPSVLLSMADRPWLTKIPLTVLDGSLLRRGLWHRFELPKALARHECTALFSPGGILPAGARVPGFTMSRNMLPFEPEELARFSLFDPTWHRLRFLRGTQLRSFRRARGLIFLSRHAESVVGGWLGASSSRAATVIPHGVSTRFFAEPRAPRLFREFTEAAPFRVLYVSIFDMYKHQPEVAAAAAQLRREGLPTSVEFVGEVPRRARAMLESVRRIDPQGTFLSYAGSVPFESLHERYRTADAFVFASSCENLPNILLEAMAAGLPIACSNRGPMPEVIGDGAVFFDPTTPEAIAHALRTLASSPDLRADLAQRAYQRARNHSWAKCADATLAFIAENAQA